jgi:hypothetical protein
MKRPHHQGCVGSSLIDEPRPDVAGHPVPVAPADVASFVDARAERAESDERIASEFAEFLSGAADPGAPILSDADPVFRERLRRRLWRLHLLAHPLASSDPH